MCHLNFVHQKQSLGISKYRFFDVKKNQTMDSDKIKSSLYFSWVSFHNRTKIIHIMQGCHQFSCPESDTPTVQQE